MQVIYSDKHRKHNPLFQFNQNGVYPYSETPTRAEAIRDVLNANPSFRFEEPKPFDTLPIHEFPAFLAVHNHAYLNYFENIYSAWMDAERPLTGVIPDTFSSGTHTRCPTDLLAQPGFYCFDAQTPIVAGTLEAATTSALCALTGAHKLIKGAKAAYALCRPPGHHATRSRYGGYCYLNNAAIAAMELSLWRPNDKLMVLDIDYHHGNGTQEIFYDSDVIVTASIHGDPNCTWPFFWGYQDQTGVGAGEGFNRNFPLPPYTGDLEYYTALRIALDYLQSFSPVCGVVSLGVDTFSGDDLSNFQVSLDGFSFIGKILAELDLPILFVQEGGYNLEKIGTAVCNLLSAFELESTTIAEVQKPE